MVILFMSIVGKDVPRAARRVFTCMGLLKIVLCQTLKVEIIQDLPHFLKMTNQLP